MKHGSKFKITGIPKGSSYKVTEQESGENGYVTTGEVTTATLMSGDVDMDIVNNRQGTVPTGIFLNYKPFWIMGAVAVVLIAVFMSKRKSRLSDEI